MYSISSWYVSQQSSQIIRCCCVCCFRLSFLVKEGYEDRIVIAHDIHTKNRLTKYGGHGYSHILRNIVPKMLSRGISQNQVDKILIDNPKQWLTFKWIPFYTNCYAAWMEKSYHFRFFFFFGAITEYNECPKLIFFFFDHGLKAKGLCDPTADWVSKCRICSVTVCPLLVKIDWK